MSSLRVLMFGDIVGAIGRLAITTTLPRLREIHHPDLVLANVENLAHGSGLTAQTIQELDRVGVDAFTGGNHSWANPLGAPLFADPAWANRFAVPMNYAGAKGGSAFVCIKHNGHSILIVSVIGQLFMKDGTTSPFATLDTILKHEGATADAVIVDIHAEATSEKEAFGHYADGRVSAVLGTHTHIPTADAKILPGGTAYLTDIGRTGAYDSVVGFEKMSSIQRFLSDTAATYEIPKNGKVEINAALITIDLETGKATALDRIREIIDV